MSEGITAVVSAPLPAKKNGQKNKNNVVSNQEKSQSATSSILCRRLAGSNWQQALASGEVSAQQKKNAQGSSAAAAGAANNKHPTKYVAMDCEMVGVGSGGRDDMLARVSLVNHKGDVLLDKFVKPRLKVVDYRTHISGIRPKDIDNGDDFERVQTEVVNLLRDRILVGHAVNNDLAVLFIKHPKKYIRDTSKYRPLAKLVANGATPSLKRLSKAILGLDIQTGEHSSVEDARAAMAIYSRFSVDWEKHLKRASIQYHHNHHRNKGGHRGR